MTPIERHKQYVNDLTMLSKSEAQGVADQKAKLLKNLFNTAQGNPDKLLAVMTAAKNLVVPAMINRAKGTVLKSRSLGMGFGQTRVKNA